jgi:hypothetical protein
VSGKQLGEILAPKSSSASSTTSRRETRLRTDSATSAACSLGPKALLLGTSCLQAQPGSVVECRGVGDLALAGRIWAQRVYSSGVEWVGASVSSSGPLVIPSTRPRSADQDTLVPCASDAPYSERRSVALKLPSSSSCVPRFPQIATFLGANHVTVEFVL